MLARADLWNLVTTAGRLDVAFVPSGTAGYADLIRNAVSFDVFGTKLDVASLEDIVRSKEAADRPQDRQDVLILRDAARARVSAPLNLFAPDVSEVRTYLSSLHSARNATVGSMRLARRAGT
jgi:hypothetical protein